MDKKIDEGSEEFGNDRAGKLPSKVKNLNWCEVLPHKAYNHLSQKHLVDLVRYLNEIIAESEECNNEE